MDNLFKSFSRSYILSAALPAAMFTLIIIALFRDFFPSFLNSRLTDASLTPSFGIVLGIIATFCLDYTLYASMEWVVKFFSGDFIPWPLNAFLSYLAGLQLDRMLLSYKQYQAAFSRKDDPVKKYRLYVAAYESVNAVWAKMPLDKEKLLPTALGNANQASIAYADNLYGMDINTFWQKLYLVLPSKVSELIEDKNIHITFLLNSSLLSFTIFLMSFVLVGFDSGIELLRSKGRIINSLISLHFGFTQIAPLGYLLLGAFFFLLGYGLYRLAVNASRERNSVYRAACDFYRADLVKSLGFELPQSLEDERRMWQDLREFFSVGKNLGMRASVIKEYGFSLKPTPTSGTSNVQVEQVDVDFGRVIETSLAAQRVPSEATPNDSSFMRFIELIENIQRIMQNSEKFYENITEILKRSQATTERKPGKHPKRNRNL